MLDNIEHVLHPTDFSEPAQNALTYAMEIAHKHDAHLKVIHAKKTAYSYGSNKMMEEIIKKNEYPDLSLETTIELGDTVSTILDLADDLIVMGTKGKGNLAKMVFGSISSEIMLKSPVPVLLVPPERNYSEFDSFIFATDYNDKDLEKLQQLIPLAKLFDAQITVLHISAEDDLKSRITFRGFKEMAKEYIDDPNMKFQLIFEENFYAGLSAFLHGQSGELIVMTRNKKPFFKSLTEEDHIQQSIYTKVPLLVLPNEETVKKNS